MGDEKTIDEARAVTQAAARAAWRAALDEQYRALTAFWAVSRTDPPGSTYQRAGSFATAGHAADSCPAGCPAVCSAA